jgi:hypothetical protein
MKQETGPIPDNHVLAVLTTSDEDAIKRELHGAGFDNVNFLTQHGVEEEVDPGAERANPVARLIYLLVNHLSEQRRYLEQYEEEARKGNRVVAVRVEDEAGSRAVAEVLARYGAVNIRFFGKLAVTDLTPQTNPSVASDQLP